MSTIRISDGVTQVDFTTALHAKWKINSPAIVEGGTGEQSIEVVMPSGASAIQYISDVERLFSLARKRYDPSTRELKDPTAPRVFVSVDMTGAGTDFWRSELFDGRCTPIDTVNIFPLPGHARFLLSFSHKPRWETNAEIAVPITNVNGANVTSGLAINNYTAAAANAYFRVTNTGSSVIIGNLPARCRIELTSVPATTGGTFYMGLIDSGTYVGALEAETSTLGTNVVDAGRSGGAAREVVLPGFTADTAALSMDIPTAIMSELSGRRARIVLVYSGSAAYTDVQAKLEIYYRGITKVAETPWTPFLTGIGIHDFETLPIPPKYLGGSNYDQHLLVLRLRKLAFGSVTLTFDHFQFIPAFPFRKVIPSGYGIDQNSVLIDDGIEEVTYVAFGSSSGARGGHYQALSSKFFELMPNRAHTFNIIHASLTGAATPSRQLSAKLFYRPARSTL